jgi:deoxyribonuclease V
VQLAHLTAWPGTPAEALEIQDRLRALVQLAGDARFSPRTVAGLDASYDTRSERVAAAVVTLDLETLTVIEESTALGTVAFDYVPGLLAFRELPTLVEVLERLTVVPDLLVCDGYGLAHPRRFGLACHVGVLTDLPTIGVAKTPFIGTFSPPGPVRGDWSEILDGGEVVGHALRTRDGVKPVFVSVGHRVDLSQACDLTLRLCTRYRLPETTRRADRLSRRLLSL